MPAVIEQDAPRSTSRCQVVLEAIATDVERPVRAPLATLATLLASFRASARQQEVEAPELAAVR